VTAYNFTVKFVCPTCKLEVPLVQFSRRWSNIDTFASADAGTALSNVSKPEIIQFKCSACNEYVVDDAKCAITGRKNMYNWLFDHKMLMNGTSVVNNVSYKLQGEPANRVIDTVPDDQCNPLLLP
jgi:hypothetical protein